LLGKKGYVVVVVVVVVVSIVQFPDKNFYDGNYRRSKCQDP